MVEVEEVEVEEEVGEVEAEVEEAEVEVEEAEAEEVGVVEAEESMPQLHLVLLDLPSMYTVLLDLAGFRVLHQCLMWIGVILLMFILDQNSLFNFQEELHLERTTTTPLDESHGFKGCLTVEEDHCFKSTTATEVSIFIH